MTYTLPEVREPYGLWIATYQIRGLIGPDGEASAIAEATARALKDAPQASVEIFRVRNTSPGRYSVTVRRVRAKE